MADRHDLLALIRARTPLIVIETREELHVGQLLHDTAAALQLPLFRWSVTEGLHRQADGYQPQRHNIPPGEVLSHIKASRLPGVYLLIDFHPYLEDARNVRLLKEIALHAERTGQTLVLLSFRLQLPAELSHLSAQFHLAPPDAELRRAIVDEAASEWQQQSGSRARVDAKARDSLVQNLTGLTASEVRRLVRNAIFDDGVLDDSDLAGVARRKYALLNRGGVLSFEPDTADYADIGGLNSLKRWLEQRRTAFAAAAEQHDLPTPKGLLLLGVQGCGKSLAAKAVAGAWDLPLLRLDLGAAYHKYYGETERNLRESLQAAEAMAPSVLWVDEIEKGLAVDRDDSLSRRVLGTLLTWMAERDARVFIVATANDISALPPELVRKGRLDEIFFVDLPDHATRKEIFAIHLDKRECRSAAFDLDLLAELSSGFSGAEIEQVVVAALYSSLGGAGTINQQLLEDEIGRTRPLSVVMHERIAALRHWAAQRTVSAN